MTALYRQGPGGVRGWLMARSDSEQVMLVAASARPFTTTAGALMQALSPPLVDSPELEEARINAETAYHDGFTRGQLGAHERAVDFLRYLEKLDLEPLPGETRLEYAARTTGYRRALLAAIEAIESEREAP